ncbi:MAG TPA: FkbM family methyltransferase [Chlamydiales bacterium]|nr:FkbM family methyltransferase [Chlamydiales bacterium]
MNHISAIFRYPMFDPSIEDEYEYDLPFRSSKFTVQNEPNRKLQKYLEQFPYEKYTVCEVKGLGLFYIDDLPDSIKWHLRRGIYWESGIGELVKKYTREGTIAIDIGAHIGIHTITMSKKVGSTGRVISFEPQFKIFRELYQNIKLNACDHNVILLRNALGDYEGQVEMSIRNPENEGGTSIGRDGDIADMRTLDSFNLDNVSFIKIDVESYELNVLRGAKETIQRNKPVIVFEILGNHDLDHCSEELKMQCESTIEFLRALGYRVYRIYGNDFIALNI